MVFSLAMEWLAVGKKTVAAMVRAFCVGWNVSFGAQENAPWAGLWHCL